MAISKKPQRKKNQISLTDAIIEKGGASPQSHHEETNTNIKITLRLSAKMLKIIDDHLSKSISKKTRTCWLREAIEEKIENDIN